jgi:predicted ATPase
LLTSFIGRQKEIIQVKELIASHRLVTLTGSGGVGKTRLASRVAEEMLEAFPNGIWLVDLASVTNPEQIAQACAQALGIFEKPDVPPIHRLVQFLGKRPSC